MVKPLSDTVLGRETEYNLSITEYKLLFKKLKFKVSSLGLAFLGHDRTN